MLPRRSPSLDCRRHSFFFVSIGTKKNWHTNRQIHVYAHAYTAAAAAHTELVVHTYTRFARTHAHGYALFAHIRTYGANIHTHTIWSEHDVNIKWMENYELCALLVFPFYVLNFSVPQMCLLSSISLSLSPISQRCCCCCRSLCSFVRSFDGCRCYRQHSSNR